MLSLSLLASGIAYYFLNAPSKARAIVNVAAIAAFGFLFIAGLSYFKKPEAASAESKSPVDILLKELDEDEEAHQLDAVAHLGEMQDARIVPALSKLLQGTKSEQVVESTAEALGKQKDPRAIPALQSAANGNYDDFLKFTIAKAQLSVGDKQGFVTLIKILKNDDAGFARQQARELLKSESGQNFGYDGQKTGAQNSGALKKIDDWWSKTGNKLKLHQK
jgi:HEAT repeat protein